MDPKDIRNLQEAYIGVYDDDIREKLEFESWVNNLLEEGYDLSDYTWDELYVSYFNEAQYTPPQQIQQPAAEVRKAPKKNTQNPAVPVLTGLALAKLGNEIGKTSLRRKKQREEGPDVKGVFEEWVTGLLDEGYDLSEYTWDELSEIYNEDYKGGPAFGMKYSKPKPLSGEKGDGSGYGPPEKFTKPDDKIEKPGTTVPPFKKGGYGRIMSNIPHGIGAHRDKIASKITTTTGGDPGAPTSQKMRVPDKKKNLEIIRKKANEAIDLYDVILAHLINEGYADTYEAAESIMVNMSENWRESILSEEPVQDYRDMKRADQNRSGIRGREFTHDTRSGLKGIPQSGSAASGGKSPAPAGSGSIRSMPSPGPVGSGSIRSMPSPGPVGSGSIGGRPSPSPQITYPKPSLDAPYPRGGANYPRGGANIDGSAGSATLNRNIPGDDFIGPTVSTGGKTYGIPNPKFGRPQR